MKVGELIRLLQDNGWKVVRTRGSHRAMTRYMIVIEQGDSSWGAYVPDLPGCIAAGDTKDERPWGEQYAELAESGE